jgi:hypothetical protein
VNIQDGRLVPRGRLRDDDNDAGGRRSIEWIEKSLTRIKSDPRDTVSTAIASTVTRSIDQSVSQSINGVESTNERAMHFFQFFSKTSQSTHLHAPSPTQCKASPYPSTKKDGPKCSREKTTYKKSLGTLESQDIALSIKYFQTLARVHLLQPRTTLVQRPIDSSSDGQSSADNGADADEEAREGL